MNNTTLLPFFLAFVFGYVWALTGYFAFRKGLIHWRARELERAGFSESEGLVSTHYVAMAFLFGPISMYYLYRKYPNNNK